MAAYDTTVEAAFAAAKQWFDAIASAVGSKKRQVIKECSEAEDETGWIFLKTYLSPYNVFHMGKKSFAVTTKNDVKPFENALDMIEYLINIQAASNDDIAKVKKTLSLFEDKDIGLFAENYITKSLKIGITADTVNKTVGTKVIPTFNCMLANKFFDKPEYVVGKHIAITEKLDGIRALAFIEPYLIQDNETDKTFGCAVKIYSRQGQQITGLIEVENALKEQFEKIWSNGLYTGSVVVDGELLITNRDKVLSKDQYKLTTKIVREDSNENKTGITYNIFDCIPKSEFVNGESDLTYGARRLVLWTMFYGCNDKLLRIVPTIETYEFSSKQEAIETITDIVTKARQRGEEGVMINISDAKYVCKRTNDLLKVKVFQDCDLEIIDFQEGTGKYQGTLGALIVDYKGTQVGVGTGLTDDLRSEIWNNKDSYFGKIVTVQYFEETCDKNGNASIRFPVFKEIREDGKEVSYC